MKLQYIGWIVALWATCAVWAQQLDIQVTAVQGIVQVRHDEGQPWKKPVVGQKLPIGAEARTGPNSALQLAVGTTGKFTLDRMGVVKILQALQEGGKIKTDMGMKYGRGGFEVQAGGVEHESTIRTPSATLAVRGSKGFLQEYAGQDPIAGSDEGRVAFLNTRGFEIPLDPGNRIQGDQNGAADLGLAQGAFLPTGPMALFGPEGDLAAVYPGGPPPPGQGGLDPGPLQQQGVNSHTISGGTGGSFTTGFLGIDIFNFTGATGSSTLQLSLLTPTGAHLTAANSGPFIHTGNQTSMGSVDPKFIQMFITSGPIETGNYTMVLNVSGPSAAQLFFEVSAQTGNGPTSVHLLGPNNITIPAGNQQNFNFVVPANTP